MLGRFVVTQHMRYAAFYRLRTELAVGLTVFLHDPFTQCGMQKPTRLEAAVIRLTGGMYCVIKWTEYGNTAICGFIWLLPSFNPLRIRISHN